MFLRNKSKTKQRSVWDAGEYSALSPRIGGRRAASMSSASGETPTKRDGSLSLPREYLISFVRV